MNTYSLIGNIVGDVKEERTRNGVVMVKNSIAYNERVKGEKVRHYFNFVAYGKTAELIIKWFNKGDEIGISGKMTQNSWNGNDGKRHSRFELLVNDVSFTRGKGRGRSADVDADDDTNDDITDGDFTGVELDAGDLPF